MTGSGPTDALWIAAIHRSVDDYTPLGTAVVIDERRVLTSAHVVRDGNGVRDGLWVAFPMCEDPTAGRCAAAVVRLAVHPMADLAVIELGEPVPAGVEPAPLRCPRPGDVVERGWWAFGFARQDPRGNEADGTVGASLGYGWVRLDSQSRYLVEPGFSGGGLWCPDYGAVVGVVGEANNRGDGRAITLHQADGYLPAEKIRALTSWTVDSADDLAKAAWGWSLAADREADRHWRPRARGVAGAAERGHRFRGRRQALTDIIAWLDRPVPDRRVLVVTGLPGVGKSAVLGRIVTTADPDGQAALPPGDDAPRATAGSVACAVHAKGKTALDVALEIARAASAPLPDRVDDLPVGLQEALAERGSGRFNLVIDALDEASDPQEARWIVTGLVLPIAATCADVGAQVVVGTRRRDDAGDLFRIFGTAITPITLDEPGYFALDDLAAYAHATLQLRGDERPDNPYQPDAVAAPVARRIAELAEQNFLVAGLVARTHGLYDREPVAVEAVSFTASVEAAFDEFLGRLAAVAGVPARTVLTALAFAEAPGFTLELWQHAVRALFATEIPVAALREFAIGSAANFLVETTRTDTSDAAPRVRSFRLFHQALADALLVERGRSMDTPADEAALTTAFIEHGRSLGWDDAPAYLFRSLPGHAARAGLVDELLTDVAYVLRADLHRLIPAATQARTTAGQEQAKLLRLTPRALTAAPNERLALLSVTESIDGSTRAFRSRPEASPYRGLWARTSPRVERSVLEGHTGGVYRVCPIRVEGRELLASAGDDHTVRIWDPATGAARHVLEGHTGWVSAVCPIRVEGRELLASAGDDRTVRTWDPASDRHTIVIPMHAVPLAVAGVDDAILVGTANGVIAVHLTPS
ncbi:MAG: trypsin-like peptidase domain-containing protein [Pseudonocardia sp.]